MRRNLLKKCLHDYYEEDKKILLDKSVIQITSSTFLIYNLIYFGNKIFIPKETIKGWKKKSRQSPNSKSHEIKINNAKYFLDKINQDERNNFNIIDSQGETYYFKIKNYLTENPNCIFYLADLNLYNRLKDEGISNNQLYLLEEGFKETNPYEDYLLKFETIGALSFENGKMVIYPKDNFIIKVYNSKGNERLGTVKEVKIKDYVLIKKEKDSQKGKVFTYKLFQIVSKHTRNHSIKIIWTDLHVGEKTNKYIESLPYICQKIIEENV